MAVTDLVLRKDPGEVWRVGFRPNAWAWSDWKYAPDDGKFNGRWDDIHGQFRTVYAGESLFACLIEVLAKYRVDAVLAAALELIEEDAADMTEFPSRPAATVSYRWLEEREASRATLSGTFCAVTESESIAALYPHFVVPARQLGKVDFDAAALKDSGPRNLTRSIASWLYDQVEPSVDGVEFTSRHGDDLRLWAIFERLYAESNISSRLSRITVAALTPETPAVVRVFSMLHLAWAD